jgi:hypothetical protein
MELAVHDKQEASFDLARHVTCHAALPRDERADVGSGERIARYSLRAEAFRRLWPSPIFFASSDRCAA